MKRVLLSFLVVLCFHVAHPQTRFWISTTVSNWNNTANWSTTSGGAGGASVPGAGDQVIFNGTGGRNGNCALDIAPTVAGISFTGYTGILNLTGQNLITTGTNVFTSGSITNSGAAASLVLNTTTATTFNGTAVSVPLTGSSGDINFNGSVFGGAINVTKTGAANNNNTGGNTFNAVVNITNNGAGEWNLAVTNPDAFNAAVTITNSGTNRVQVGVNAVGTIFAAGLTINHGGNSGASTIIARNTASTVTINGNLVLNSSNAANSGIIVGSNGAVTMNGNVSVSSSSGLGIYLGGDSAGGTGTFALANGFSVSSPAGAFTTGTLWLLRVTQNGATTQTLNLGGTTTTLIVGPGAQFNGAVNFASPQIYMNGATFNGAATLEKTGATDNASNGGNTFAGATTITNSGSGEIFMQEIFLPIQVRR